MTWPKTSLPEYTSGPPFCWIHGPALRDTRLEFKSVTPQIIKKQTNEPLAQLLRFGQPRQAFRFRQGRGTGSDGCPGRLHGPGCGGMPQLVARRAPSAHGWPRRPLRGGVRGGRICRNGRCQMVSRISCSTVRASTPKNRWQATLACPRTRTCRAP